MSAKILAFPCPKRPIVYLLSGRSGIGKTRLLSHYAELNPQTIDYHLPMKIGERFTQVGDF
jgi:hypothetical protein